MNKVFLTAAWRKLIMANYAVDANILKPYLPRHTELDYRDGTCYISLVGFMFLNTRLKGIKIPFHTNFEEVNLRFYVRFKEAVEWKRGTVFIKEIVPKPAVTFVANSVYGEKYDRPMKHEWSEDSNSQTISYEWKKKNWNTIKVVADKQPLDLIADSEASFIAVQHWGLSKGRNQTTSKYSVEHPAWQMYKTKEAYIDVDFEDNYGPAFKFLNDEAPTCVFLVEGSDVL
ncbi:MAG TPA: DUF2071 domain-containing protein, partial [Saprospiraceae bacterium]